MRKKISKRQYLKFTHSMHSSVAVLGMDITTVRTQADARLETECH